MSSHAANPDESVARLLASIDSDDMEEAEEARYELQTYGARIVGPLITAVPGFGRLGQLLAIEVFSAIGDTRAGATIIPMLRSDDDTVREAAAWALGDIGVLAAVPELLLAYDRLKLRGTPLDWSEPESMRWALSALGAREVVMPSRVAALSRREGSFARCWNVEHLPEVLRQLAAAGQVVLYFQYWEQSGESHSRKKTPTWQLEWLLSWDALVKCALQASLDAARIAGVPDYTVATIAWIDVSDS